MFQIFFTDQEKISDYRDFCRSVDRIKFRDFSLKLFDKGIYMNPSATLHSLSAVVHNEEDIRVTAQAISETLDEL
jgi:glutamate-1-semialdehyde 2,1-aminomutase